MQCMFATGLLLSASCQQGRRPSVPEAAPTRPAWHRAEPILRVPASVVQMERRGVQPDAQLVSTIMWSVAVFEHFSLPIFRKMMRLLDGMDPAKVDADSLHRINMVSALSQRLA